VNLVGAASSRFGTRNGSRSARSARSWPACCGARVTPPADSGASARTRWRTPYQCFPVWRPGPAGDENLDPATLPISEELAAALMVTYQGDGSIPEQVVGGTEPVI
jgi:hypothetical protein